MLDTNTKELLVLTLLLEYVYSYISSSDGISLALTLRNCFICIHIGIVYGISACDIIIFYYGNLVILILGLYLKSIVIIKLDILFALILLNIHSYVAINSQFNIVHVVFLIYNFESSSVE